jgi:hypothetical protein
MGAAVAIGLGIIFLYIALAGNSSKLIALFTGNNSGGAVASGSTAASGSQGSTASTLAATGAAQAAPLLQNNATPADENALIAGLLSSTGASVSTSGATTVPSGAVPASAPALNVNGVPSFFAATPYVVDVSSQPSQAAPTFDTTPSLTTSVPGIMDVTDSVPAGVGQLGDSSDDGYTEGP